MKKKALRFYIYKNWKMVPECIHKSYKPVGKWLISTKSHRKALYALSELEGVNLIICRHIGGEEALSGTREQCRKFILDCWKDYR